MSIYSSMCAGKREYPDKRAAKEAIRSLCAAGRSHKSTLNAYKCLFCQQWHVGHNYKSYRTPPPPPAWSCKK